jgi:hypothetical protein
MQEQVTRAERGGTRYPGLPQRGHLRDTAKKGLRGDLLWPQRPGRRVGGHAHNDKLSFELCVDGEDIIVDPGSYIYALNPEMRNHFRCAASHGFGA